MPSQIADLDLSFLRLHRSESEAAPTNHFVEIYENDFSLADSIRTFISMGMQQGEPAVVVADPEHREAIEQSLQQSIDLTFARDHGMYVSLDAAETLNGFIRGGHPDGSRFDDVVGSVIRMAAANGRTVRVFGEMVALLWEQGNVVGAVELEQLWNRLAQEIPFRLFCAYPARAFSPGDLDSLAAVCGEHSHVLVSEANANSR